VKLVWTHALDGIDWNALSALYRIAPLGDKKPEALKTVFGNSMYRCLVYDTDQRLVAAGRALADGLDCAYICDVAVHPDLQGQGIGKEMVARLVDLSRGHKKIILYAVVGKEAFYRKLGFRRMNTAMAIFANQEQAIAQGLLSNAPD
jgi:ribosomal protein S18 acetylase RimI-like enzyme